jgi:hypothetical protein
MPSSIPSAVTGRFPIPDPEPQALPDPLGDRHPPLRRERARRHRDQTARMTSLPERTSTSNPRPDSNPAARSHLPDSRRKGSAPAGCHRAAGHAKFLHSISVYVTG